MTGSKRVDHWTSGTVYECSEIAGSPQGSPQQPAISVVKPEGGPPASVKPGQKSYVRSSGIITLSARRPSDSSGRSPPQMRPQWSITSGHQCSETMLTGESRFHISTPPGNGPGSLMTGRWNCVWMQWDCRLTTFLYLFRDGCCGLMTFTVAFFLFAFDFPVRWTVLALEEPPPPLSTVIDSGWCALWAICAGCHRSQPC